MSDFSFMKSGFDNLVNNDEEKMKENITILVATFATEGLKHASRYVSHHKTRNSVTGEDIKRGMMLEVFLFNNRPDLIDKFDEIKLLINNEDEEEEEEEEDEGEEDEEVEFTSNDCECAICKCMNTIHTRWENFTPTTPLETIMKNNIDAIEL